MNPVAQKWPGCEQVITGGPAKGWTDRIIRLWQDEGPGIALGRFSSETVLHLVHVRNLRCDTGSVDLLPDFQPVNQGMFTEI